MNRLLEHVAGSLSSVHCAKTCGGSEPRAQAAEEAEEGAGHGHSKEDAAQSHLEQARVGWESQEAERQTGAGPTACPSLRGML